jgi:hypothetical protein
MGEKLVKRGVEGWVGIDTIIALSIALILAPVLVGFAAHAVRAHAAIRHQIVATIETLNEYARSE